MNTSIKKGISFGLTSSTITTLGLFIGLSSSTNAKNVVVAGILMIAFADSLSDALGIHISEEAENHHSNKEIWEATFATAISKFIIAVSFLPAVLMTTLKNAIVINFVWGLILLSFLSVLIAKQNCEKVERVVTEHLVIGGTVVIVSYYIGYLINYLFK